MLVHKMGKHSSNSSYRNAKKNNAFRKEKENDFRFLIQNIKVTMWIYISTVYTNSTIIIRWNLRLSFSKGQMDNVLYATERRF